MFKTITNGIFAVNVLLIIFGLISNKRGRFETGTWRKMYERFPIVIMPAIIIDSLFLVIKRTWPVILIPFILGCGIGLYQHDLIPALYGFGWCLPLACAITALDLSGR
jgi:hypothetical protein